LKKYFCILIKLTNKVQHNCWRKVIFTLLSSCLFEIDILVRRNQITSTATVCGKMLNEPIFMTVLGDIHRTYCVFSVEYVSCRVTQCPRLHVYKKASFCVQ